MTQGYLGPWLDKQKDSILHIFATCHTEEVIKLQGEMNMLEKLQSKIRNDIQSGELAHQELIESFDSK